MTDAEAPNWINRRRDIHCEGRERESCNSPASMNVSRMLRRIDHLFFFRLDGGV